MVATSARAWATSVPTVEGAGVGTEEVQGADDLAPQAHGQGLYCREPTVVGLCGDAASGGSARSRQDGDGCAGAEAL